MKERKLNHLNKTEIQTAYEYQKEFTDWTFYSEREFIENLFYNRFNYLLVAYSLFVTAFIMVNGKANRLIILALGLLVTSIMEIWIYRAFKKLTLILSILCSLDDRHVFPILRKEKQSKRRYFASDNVNPIIGIIIPLILIISFIGSILLIAVNIWVLE